MIDVVTSVLQFNDKILLLKRSDNVRTYKGKWACVSGYLEKDDTPLDRAYAEIKEETKIPLSRITVQKQGKPVDFYDKQNRTHWRIHPFLFKTDIATVTLDWEHDAFKWITIQELHSFDTVPKLAEVVLQLM